MSRRRRTLFIVLLGYMFTFGLVLPFMDDFFTVGTFADRLWYAAWFSIPFWIAGTAIGAAALDGAQALLALISEKTQSREQSRSNVLRSLLLVLGVVAYGVAVAYSRFSGEV